MKKHMVKLIAIVMTAVMVLSLVPVAALPEVNWPELLSVFGASSSANTNETEGGSDPAAMQSVAELTPTNTEDMFTDGSGNVYVDADGDGVAELIHADEVEISDDFDISDAIASVEQGKVVDNTQYNDTTGPDMATGPVDKYLPWDDSYAAYGATQSDDGMTLDANGNKVHKADNTTSPYEPWETNDEKHPFLQQGAAWINLAGIYYGAPATPTYPFTKWSANTSFLSSATEYDSNGTPTGCVFPDVDLIDGSLWADSNYQNTFNNEQGIVYNRYDPQQDKWGITLDKNVNNGEYVEWDADKRVNLAENPYLLFSTEQIDGQQLAIAVKIGTPNANGSGYTYRWYTITDSLARPGIVQTEFNKCQSMEPNVKISAVITDANPVEPVFDDLSVEIISDTADDSIYNVTESTVADNGYVDGALCGCIDMVQWLPLVDDAEQIYDIDTVRVYARSKARDVDEKQAARINYLYFLNQASNFLLPMSDTGLVDVSNAANAFTNSTNTADKFKTYNNGWVNAAAITRLDMTINSTYNMTIDTNDYVAKGLDTFTDKNTNKTYAMVTIPIRKWSNLSWDARRLLIKFNSGEARPTVMISGGSLTGLTGAKLGDNGLNNENESILGIFGGMKDGQVVTPYVPHPSTPSYANGEDLVYAQAQVYNGDATWYDWLECKYVDDRLTSQDVVKLDGTVETDGSYGWLYISAVNIIMPVNASMTIYSFDTKPVGDALNQKDNSSDGGSGVQAQILGEGETISYSSKPAAFGPYLDHSIYVNQDLLARYQNGNTTMNSDKMNNDVYGKLIEIVGANQFYTEPGNKTEWWFTTGQQYRMYATVENDSNFYGLVSNENGFWWIKIGEYVEGKGYVIDTNRVTYLNADTSSHKVMNLGSWSAIGSTAAVLKKLQDVWVVGNLATSKIDDDNGTTIKNYDTTANETFVTWDSSNAMVKFKGSQLVQHSWFNGLNIFTSTAGVSTVNSTDTKFVNTGHGALTRIYSEPITILGKAQGGLENSLLHYDFDLTFSDSDSRTYIELAVKDENNTITNYWLTGNASAVTLSATEAAFSGTNAGYTCTGYIDLTNLVGKSIVGMRVYYGNGGTVHFRRLEVVSEKTNWKDEIHVQDNGIVADGFNILDDAFNQKIVRSGASFNSRIKQYGPKGWTIHASRQVNTSEDDTLPVYYDAQLGHMVLKNVGLGLEDLSKTNAAAQVLLTSKYSWNTEEYPYLYLSFAMRDVDKKISVEDTSGSGVAAILVSDPSGNYTGTGDAYYVHDSGLVAVGSNNQYGKYIGNHLYHSMNIAIDLRETPLTSLNQIKFYLYNRAGDSAEFYINYCYLSNVEPSDEYAEEITRSYYHAYYLMDDSGDRYSTRFPTVNNPTGQVTTVIGETGRVNPMIVERGSIFYTGHFFNGEPVSDGTGSAASLRKVWFYDYADTPSGKKNVSEYYYRPGYKDVNGNEHPQGEMQWNYNRWIGASSTLEYDGSSSVTGDMMRLYATANNVLLRSGLKPIKYRTVFDTQGGQMVYGGNSYNINTNNNGIFENENNIFNTEAVILSYYLWPTVDKKNVNPVKYGFKFDGWYTLPQDHPNVEDALKLALYRKREATELQNFYAWWVPESGTDPVSGEDWSELVNKITFLRADGTTTWYERDASQANNFQIKIPNVVSIEHGGTTKMLAGWLPVPAGETRPALDPENPPVLYAAGTILTVTKDFYFYPITVEEWNTAMGDTASTNKPHTVKVTGGKLFACRSNGETWFEITETSLPGVTVTETDGVITYTNIPHVAMLQARADAPNVSRCWEVNYGGKGTAFSVVNTGDGQNDDTFYSFTVASYKDYYQFSVYTDISLNYTTLSNAGSWGAGHEMKDENGVLIWTAPKAYVEKRQMLFTSQYELPEGATKIESGTLYTQNRQFNNIVGSSLDGLTQGTNQYNCALTRAFDSVLRFSDHDNRETVSTSARYKSASAVNKSNQYYLMVTVNGSSRNTYYARGYVIYEWTDGKTYVAYSDIIAVATLTEET